MANDNGLLDIPGTLTRLDGDEFLLGEIARIFITTAPDEVGVLTEALGSGDVKRVYEQAHSLKGSVGAFEAPEVFKAVVELERRAKDGDAAGAAAVFPGVCDLIEHLIAELAPVVPAEA